MLGFALLTASLRAAYMHRRLAVNEVNPSVLRNSTA